jgi:hypothetical protein
MFKRKYPIKNEEAHQDDVSLHALLKMWPGIEPSIEFDEIVWRIICTEPIPKKNKVLLFRMFQERILSHSKLVTAAAASIAIVIGIFAGVESGVRPRNTNAHPLLQEHTLAGAYLSMFAGRKK